MPSCNMKLQYSDKVFQLQLLCAKVDVKILDVSQEIEEHTPKCPQQIISQF